MSHGADAMSRQWLLMPSLPLKKTVYLALIVIMALFDVLAIIQVASNGVVSFGGEFIQLYSNLEFPFPTVPLIAPFWADTDTENTGEVLYRFTANQTLISEVNLYIHDAFDMETSLEMLFIATWNRVVQYNIDSSQVTIRAYRPTEGGKRVCNSHRPFTDGKMLVVTNFRTRFEWQHPAGLGRRALPQPYKETANIIFNNH